MKYIIAGISGVGKTTVAKLLSDRYRINHLDLDEIRVTDSKMRKGRVSPCSITFLNLDQCLSSMLDNSYTGFVLDIGGQSVFREGKDNPERIAQIHRLKSKYEAKLIVFHAKKECVHQRFISTKKRQSDEFDPIWDAWENLEKSNWLQCADEFIDTTNLSPENIIQLIEKSYP